MILILLASPLKVPVKDYKHRGRDMVKILGVKIEHKSIFTVELNKLKSRDQKKNIYELIRSTQKANQ